MDYGYVRLGNTKFYNTTPNTIRILDDELNVILEIPKAKKPLQILVKSKLWSYIENVIPLTCKSLVTNSLPAPAHDTYFIVSPTIANISLRGDFLIPYDPILDADGNVIGYRSLAMLG
jgi:hypothetical protein